MLELEILRDAEDVVPYKCETLYRRGVACSSRIPTSYIEQPKHPKGSAKRRKFTNQKLVKYIDRLFRIWYNIIAGKNCRKVGKML